MTARGGRPSVARGALLILGVVGWVGLIWIGATLYSSTPPKAGFDLELLLRAGRDVAAGRSPYDPALVAGTAPVAESLFYSYPPVVAQAMTLVGWVPSPVALVAWGVAAVAGLAAVAIALARRFAPGRTALEVALPVIALAPLCFPFAIGLLFGNFDVFFPLLYGAMLLAVTPGARRETVTSGGVALAVAAIAKLHPASLGAWFGVRGLTGDRRAARVFVIAAAVGVAALVASLVIGGVGPWADYLAVVRAGSNADLVDPRNAGPAAQLALLLGGDDRFARTAQIAVTAAVLVVTVAAARRGGDPVARLAWAAAASLATLPVTWFHYPSALIPFGLAALFRSDGRPLARSVERLIAAALVIAAIAIAFLPLLWVSIGLVLAAVRLSAPGDTEMAPPTVDQDFRAIRRASSRMQGFRQTSVGTDTDYHLVALSGVGATNEDARDMHHWFVAYIDPGAGSLIVQATIASIVAIPFFLRRQISRALRVLARLDVRSDSARRPVDPSS